MSLKTTPSTTVLVMILAVLIVNNKLSNTEALNTTLVVDDCSDDKYTAEDPYGGGVLAVLDALRTTTADAYQYDQTVTATVQQTGENVYGHAKCEETLEPEECTECLGVAESHLLSTCALSIYASVELADCDMKYDDEPIQG